MTQSLRFPQALLDQSAAARLHYFKNITVPHRHLQAALDQLLLNLREPADISIFFIVGPSGVGKTTLRLRAEKILLTESLPELRANPAHIPVAGMEVAASEQGKFSHRDYYMRVLDAVDEVLVAYKSNYGLHYSPDAIHPQRSLAALRRSLEHVLRHRQVKTLMVDEAHHLVMMAGARQMLQQMNWIKSMANITQTTHALFGTYELLNCCRLSGQLSRRSEDIHLPRYQKHSQADVTEFIRVLQTFQRHLPLATEPTLDQWCEYLLEYSVGCIGILKTWLIRALRTTLTENASTITMKHLQQHQLSVARFHQLQEEAESGEQHLINDRTDTGQLSASQPSQKPSTPKRQVGKRNPKRDLVGGQS